MKLFLHKQTLAPLFFVGISTHINTHTHTRALFIEKYRAKEEAKRREGGEETAVRAFFPATPSPLHTLCPHSPFFISQRSLLFFSVTMQYSSQSANNNHCCRHLSKNSIRRRCSLYSFDEREHATRNTAKTKKQTHKPIGGRSRKSIISLGCAIFVIMI